jgi:TPP-dependent 2-oxoacid decarboxylase
MGDGNSCPLFLWGMIMEKEERKARMNELLDKEDFNYTDYLELKSLIDEDEKEYYGMKDRFMKAVYGMK